MHFCNKLERFRFVYDKWIQKVEMKDIDTLNLLQKRLPFESKEVKNFLFQTLQQLLSNSSLNIIIEVYLFFIFLNHITGENK